MASRDNTHTYTHTHTHTHRNQSKHLEIEQMTSRDNIHTYIHIHIHRNRLQHLETDDKERDRATKSGEVARIKQALQARIRYKHKYAFFAYAIYVKQYKPASGTKTSITSPHQVQT